MFFQLKKTLRLDTNHVDALNYLGYTYAERGINLDEALELIKKAVKLAPERGYIRDSLGWVYFKKDMHNDALREIKKAAETMKDDPVVFEHLGDVYMKLDNKKAAMDAWEKSLKFHETEEGLKERVEKKIKGISQITNN
jgi:tetratricopeptide (TPR) repeat protein